jgi:hypothetical protein
MFNWPRLRNFLGNVSTVVIPFLSMALGLALLTEILTHLGELPGVLRSGRFWLAVGLDMLPVIMAMVLVLWFAGLFLRPVYRLDSWRHGMTFLLRSRCGLRQFRPWMRIHKGEIDAVGTDVLNKIGGPGHLVIHHDSAVVLERAGRLTRVVGAGVPALERFEKVYDVIDLRPKRSTHNVRAMTREGVPVNWEVELRYQIDSGKEVATEKAPYPLSEDHVLRAATCKWVQRGGGSSFLNWEGRLIVAEAERSLRTILSCRRLDELIGLTEQDDRAAREAIRAELEVKLREAAPKMAAKILSVKLDNLTVDDAVTQQWIKAWKANWQNWSSKRLAHAEASYVHQYETAKAEAQMQMIVQITEVLQRQLASRTITSQAVPQMILMRLFSVLDRADFASSSRVFFPTQTMHALEGIRQALSPGQAFDIATLVLTADSPDVAPGGQVDLKAALSDRWGNPAPDGTLVHFRTTLASVAPTSATTVAGQAGSTFIAGAQQGLAIVTARSGSVTGTTTIRVI